MFKYNKTKEGFTILEVLVTMFVLTIGGLAAYAMVQQIIFYTFSSSYRLTAAHLAKEGIEIVRNIRDTNWLEQESWDNGLVPGEWEADFNDNPPLFFYAGRKLRFDNNFYSYDSGVETRYKRKITIVSEGSDELKISVEVEWEEKGETYTIVVQENLYNWY